jgi:hypothetical protein
MKRLPLPDSVVKHREGGGYPSLQPGDLEAMQMERAPTVMPETGPRNHG